MFPERFTVSHEVLVKGAKDAMGVPVVTFSTAVSVPVFGWATPSQDNVLRPEQSGVERDLDLYCAGAFAGPGDRITVAGVLYTTVGYPEDYRYGPFGYAPGVRINLRRVEG